MQNAVIDDPGNADAHNLLGFALCESGHIVAARQSYRKALHLVPDHLGANEYLGELLVETGDLPGAHEWLCILAAAGGIACEEYLDLAAAISAADADAAR